MPTNPNVPMSREELTSKLVELMDIQHYHCFGDGSCTNGSIEEQQLNEVLGLIAQARAEGARQMALDMKILPGSALWTDDAGVWTDAIVKDWNNRIDHLITQYQEDTNDQ